MRQPTSYEKKREIHQLALQLQNIKIEQQYKTIRLLLLSVFMVAALGYFLSLYADIRVKSSRENFTTQVNYEMGLATGGNKEREASLQERLPLLEQYVQHRINRESGTGEAKNAASTREQGESVKPITVFIRFKSRTHSVGKISNLENVEIVESQTSESSNWLPVTLKKGMPMWISAEHLKATVPFSIEGFTTTRVNLRKGPVIDPINVVGILEKGIELKVVETQGDWLKVETPPDFQFLVRKSDYQKFSI